jgi:predicted XRE-type DNA-binding protein
MNRDKSRTIRTPLRTLGSHNVYADLCFFTPKEELLKEKLVSKIADVIEKREMTQFQAGEIMGLQQSKVSELCNGRTETYSVERLYRCLTRLGVGVSIILEDQPDWSHGKIEIIEPNTEANENSRRAPKYKASTKRYQVRRFR